MITLTNKNKLLLLVMVLAVALCIVLSPLQSAICYAETNGVNFDKTNVLDDLQSSTVNGKPFDITQYPYSENSTIQVIDFVEYCYSYRANQRDNYGLYIYVYNILLQS